MSAVSKSREVWFQQIVESAPNGFVIVDESGNIVLTNARCERMFGYSREELVGLPVDMLVPERLRGLHLQERRTFLDDPRARPMGAGRDLYARRKDGSEFPIEIALNPLQGTEKGMVLASVIDITERKRLESRFRMVVESAPSAMVMVDSSGLIVLVNTQAERVFGYARDEIIGEPIELLIPERFHHAHPGYRDAYFDTSDARPMGAGRDLFARRKDGHEFAVEVGLNPIDTDEGAMVLAAIVDITERKQAEEFMHASLREKEVLIKEVYHRVKNNLQVLGSLIGLQERSLSDSSARRALRHSASRVRTMALVHEMLYQSETLSCVDFAAYVDSLVRYLSETFDARHNGIETQTDIADVQLSIETIIPLGLIINELLTNSFNHAYPEGRTGTVRISLRGEGDSNFVLVVSDDGTGMPRNFDHAASSSLGLKLVHALAAQLGGRVDSRIPAEGTEIALIV